MKTIFSILMILSLPAAAQVAVEVPRMYNEYNPAKWPRAELKLSRAGTLKDVFDSGLRPYRFPGLEFTTLEVKHLNLDVILDSRKKLPTIQVEMLRIKTFLDGEIATIEGSTPRLTLEQARTEMLKWLPYSENQRTEEDLDSYLKAVEKDPMDFDDPYHGRPDGCSVIWKEPGWKQKGGGPQVVAWFRKAASATKPLNLYYKISWGSNRPLKDSMTIHDQPIAPPPGYEHVDMQAPKNYGPDSMVEILRSKGVDIGDGKGGIPIEEYLKQTREKPRPLPVKKLSPANHAPEPESSTTRTRFMWPLVLVIVLVPVFCVYAYRKRKGKSSIK